VLDLLEHRSRLEDIAVVTAAPLPKAVVHIAVRLPILHKPEKLAGMPMDKQQGALGDRLLDRVQDVADVIDRFGRPDQEVSMLRHDDIRPHMKMELAASPINRFDQPLAAPVLAQERLPAKAGKGEGVSIARVIVPFARLAMRHVDGLRHAHGFAWAWLSFAVS